MMTTMVALRLASKRTTATSSIGRQLFIVQEQRQNLWTVPDSRLGFQLSAQNVQAHPEMASQVFRRMSMEVRKREYYTRCTRGSRGSVLCGELPSFLHGLFLHIARIKLFRMTTDAMITCMACRMHSKSKNHWMHGDLSCFPIHAFKIT
jgi:hypothetical protein